MIALDPLDSTLRERDDAIEQRDAARMLIDEIIQRIDRIEDAEELRGLTTRFRRAYDLHLSGANDEAVALLRADMEDEP